MEARHSLYRQVHKGIRRMMFDLLSRAGRTEFRSTDAISLLRSETKSCFELLTFHAHHENEFTGPLVRKHAPRLSPLVAPAHDEQEKQIEILSEMVDAIDPAHPRASIDGEAFTVRLSSFFGELLVHMADEEERIMPALWHAMTDEELIEVEQRLVASIPPEKLARFLSWMIPAMNHPERVEMLTGMRDRGPAEVFIFVRDLSRSVLSEADYAALENALPVGSAA